MRLSSQLALGRLSISTMPHKAPPQLGGKRPPHDPNSSRHSRSLSRFASGRSNRRLHQWLRVCATTTAGAVVAASIANAQPASSSLPDMSGNYHCEGDAKTCDWSGTNFAVTQSGSDLEIKNEKGVAGSAKLTSNATLSAGPVWNMLGVVSPDNRAIQWSNGTTWRKQ
jgi:hypothetical protein